MSRTTNELRKIKLDWKIKSQKKLERGELPEREDQQTSGRLKSPRIMRFLSFSERDVRYVTKHLK